HARARSDAPGAHEVDQRRHRLPLVHRVGDHTLEPRAEPDRVDRLRVRDAVRACVPLVEQDHVVSIELATQTDRLAGAARDAKDLRVRLLDCRRTVDAEYGAWALLR